MFGRNIQAQVERRPGYCSVRPLGAVTKPGAVPVAVSANPPCFLGGPSDRLCFPPRVPVPHQPGHQWPLGFRQHGLHRAVPGVGGGRCPLELAVNSVKARTQLRQMFWTGGASSL